MPYAMVPPGYQVHLLGSASSLDGLSVFAPLEEGLAEGALMLMRLDFEEYPSAEALTELNAQLLEEGIPPWPGYGYIVYADTATPSVYLAWQKGIAWMPVILGLLAITVLPALLGAFIWWVLPESITQMIEAMFMFGMMFLVMWLMTKMIRPLTAAEKPGELKEGG